MCRHLQIWRGLYNQTSFTLQGYVCEKNCVTKSQEVCQNVETTVCELEGYADCKEELVETDFLPNDGTEIFEFTPHVCKKVGEQIVTTYVDEPICEDKKTWVCDSVWILGPGGKMIEKKENCREDMVPDCRLNMVPVHTPYPKYECKPEPPIKYVKPIYQTKKVNRYASRCEAKALPKCSPLVETRCTTVTYQECDEHWTRTSMDIIQQVPDQKFDHRLKCIYL